MKILQINKYSTLKGGTETVLFNTISLLRKAGHTVMLFSSENKSDIQSDAFYYLDFPELREAGFVNKMRFFFSFFYNRKAITQLDKILDIEKPDIVHIHLFLNSFSISILPAIKRKNIPIVMTLHDYRQICPSYLLLNGRNQICERCKKGYYYHCLFFRCSKGLFFESLLLTAEMYFRRLFYPVEKYVDAFICVSSFAQSKHWEFNTELGRRSFVIPNPSHSRSYQDTSKGSYMLYYGRLSREKGLFTLLKVARLLPQIEFRIAGRGLLELSGSLPSNVTFLGFKKGIDLESLILNSSFVIVPSEWYETFGLVVTESFSLSKPVIGANIGTIPELISHGKNGYLSESGNVKDLVDVISYANDMSKDDYSQMCKNANNSLERFSEHNYVTQLVNLYELCQNNNSREI